MTLFLAAVLLAASAAPDDIRLAGDSAWTAPLVRLLPGRFPESRISLAEGPIPGAWLVEIEVDANGGDLLLTLVDPAGATARERWPLSVDEGSHEMAVRSLAAWLTSVLQHEVTLPFSGSLGPPEEEEEKEEIVSPRQAVVVVPQRVVLTVPAETSRLGLSAGVGVLSDLDRQAATLGPEVRLRWGDFLWTGLAALVEPRHQVAKRPVVRRWSVPFRWEVGVQADAAGWVLEGSAGLGASIGNVQVRQENGVERFNVGVALGGSFGRRFGNVSLGLRMALLSWLRRQELHREGEVVYRGPFLQGYGGLEVGYRFDT